MVGKLQDAKFGLARRDATWRGLDGWQDRQCAVFALSDPNAPIAA